MASTSTSFELIVTEDGEFSFNLKIDGICCRITLDGYITGKKEEYASFVDAVSKDLSFDFFKGCNGGAGMRTKEGVTSFEVSRFGTNHDGEIELEVPNKVCLKALQKVLTYL